LPDALHSRIEQVIKQGTDIIDVGGESTRPGYAVVAGQEEIGRVVPVIRAIREVNQDIPISIDTRKAEVAEAALSAGADFVNDVSALTDPDMANIITRNGCSIIMMRHEALENNLSESCKLQTAQLIEFAQQRGISKQQILLDPGLGFGDLATQDFQSLPGGNVAANLELVHSIDSYSHNLPVVIGASRKRFVGQLSGEIEAKDRLAGSIAIAYMALRQGVSILRVHDISQTVQVRDIVLSNR